MRQQQRYLYQCMAPLLAFLVGGCGLPTEKVLYEGTYNGMRYVVKSHEIHTWNGSRTDWRVRLGALPELPITITRRYGTPVEPDGAVTTDWGPPYEDALYGTYERIYVGQKPAYSSKGDLYDSQPAQHDYTMLYMSAGTDNDVFRQYAAFMNAEWAKVDEALTPTTTNFPHIIGLVRASRQRFIRSFRGMIRGQPMVLRIDPDGYVNFDQYDNSGITNRMRHCAVQMPRKAIVLHEIYLWSDNGATKADIRQFRDRNGKSPEDYFVLED